VLLLPAVLAYVGLLRLIGPEQSFPDTVASHPIFEAKNVTDFKLRNNLKLILVWTRLQV
jgi:hypothetical protein